jgi:hypothetical protein
VSRGDVYADMSRKAYEHLLWLAIREAQQLGLGDDISMLAFLHERAGKLRREAEASTK